MMKSSSSTFSFNNFEIIPGSRSPAVVPLVLLLIVAIELFFRSTLIFYSDSASWYWHSKSNDLARVAQRADTVFLGTSVTFHSINAAAVNQSIEDARCYNLALNGLSRQHQVHLFKRFVRRGIVPRELVLEFRDCEVTEASWKSGPSWRFWQSYPEFQESGYLAWEPSAALQFAFQRIFTSFAFREVIDSWIFDCAKEFGVSKRVLRRNERISKELHEYRGCAPNAFEKPLLAEPETVDRPFRVNRAGRYWLEQLLQICRTNQVRVTLYVPPVPMSVKHDRERSGYYRDLKVVASDLNERFGPLGLWIVDSESYSLSDFADDHHLSKQGGQKLTEDVCDWWRLRSLE